MPRIGASRHNTRPRSPAGTAQLPMLALIMPKIPLGFIKTIVWAASKSVWQAESSVPVRRALDETLVTSL